MPSGSPLHVTYTEPMTLAIVQGFLANQGDAWGYSLDTLGGYFPEALARQAELQSVPVPTDKLFALSQQDIPALPSELPGFSLESAQNLAQHTAELHLVLAQEHETLPAAGCGGHATLFPLCDLAVAGRRGTPGRFWAT